jgi:predicted transposase/invertase (TIGR01784 family)
LKNVIDTAIAEGKTEGRMIGLIEGKTEGLIEGKIEGKIEIARNAIAENIPIDIIIRLTGLTEEELEKLENE